MGVGLLMTGLAPAHREQPASAAPRPARMRRRLRGIHKIRHVIVIMQENRSFDSYFGTYPGADGLPKNVCVPDPKTGGCDRPYHDPHVLNRGGPHTVGNAAEDIAGGRMNGFVHEAEQAQPCGDLTSPWCRKHGKIDVVGYHDAREIPNYWDYARSYVLQDHMFEPSASWSLPAHLFMVSEWSARCANLNPYSCTNELKHPAQPPAFGHTHTAPALYAWTDLTYLLYKHHVSWRYYVMRGGCPPARSNLRTRLRNYLVAVLWGFYADFLRFLRGERRPHCVLQGR